MGLSSHSSVMEKIAFRLGPNDEHPIGRWEYLLARERGEGTFQIDNIPLLVRGISVGDLVSVVRHEMGLLFRQRLASGGHSTFRVLVPGPAGTDAAVSRLCAILRRLGCAPERRRGLRRGVSRSSFDLGL